MLKRRVYDDEKHIHFVTFSCDERRNFLQPVRAGLVEKAAGWKWSSSRWYVEGKPVGLPIRWPPGLETEDEFNVGA